MDPDEILSNDIDEIDHINVNDALGYAGSFNELDGDELEGEGWAVGDVAWAGDENDMKVLAETYASIALEKYLHLTGQSTDRRAWVLTMAEVKRVAIDVIESISGYATT